MAEVPRKPCNPLRSRRSPFATGAWAGPHAQGILIAARPELCSTDAPSGSKLHVDPTRAVNYALAMRGYKDKPALALWLFIHPASFAAVRAILVDLGLAQRKLTAEELLGIVEARPEGPYAALAPYQHHLHGVAQAHGDTVEVPPGYAHAVTNVYPCVKVAFDVVRREEMAQYAGAAMLAVAARPFAAATEPSRGVACIARLFSASGSPPRPPLLRLAGQACTRCVRPARQALAAACRYAASHLHCWRACLPSHTDDYTSWLRVLVDECI